MAILIVWAFKVITVVITNPVPPESPLKQRKLDVSLAQDIVGA